jgi:hypothetical protein
MRLALLGATLLCVCSCAAAPLRLERYRGAYSTHFEGIPDQAEACAVLHNRGSTPVEWVELRLTSQSALGDVRSELKSSWVYRARIEPGARIAVRFEHPPVGEEIRVRLVRAGAGGRPPHNGRPLRSAKDCSDESLLAELDARLRERADASVEIHAAARTTRDAAEDELVASP